MAQTEKVKAKEFTVEERAEYARHSFSSRLKSAHSRLVSGTSVRQVFNDLKIQSRTLFVPVLGGEPLRCADIRELRRIARANGELLVVENTIPSSFGCPATQLGAHVAIECLDYVLRRPNSGAFAVSVSRDASAVFKPIRQNLEDLPALPAECGAEVWEALRTFNSRRRVANDVASTVANYLVCHPRVGRVVYPGLPKDPGNALAARELRNGFGPIVGFKLGLGLSLPEEEFVLDGDSFTPGTVVSRVRQLKRISTEDGAWYRILCGNGDARELVLSLEALLAQA